MKIECDSLIYRKIRHYWAHSPGDLGDNFPAWLRKYDGTVVRPDPEDQAYAVDSAGELSLTLDYLKFEDEALYIMLLLMVT